VSEGGGTSLPPPTAPFFRGGEKESAAFLPRAPLPWEKKKKKGGVVLPGNEQHPLWGKRETPPYQLEKKKEGKKKKREKAIGAPPGQKKVVFGKRGSLSGLNYNGSFALDVRKKKKEENPIP